MLPKWLKQQVSAAKSFKSTEPIYARRCLVPKHTRDLHLIGMLDFCKCWLLSQHKICQISLSLQTNYFIQRSWHYINLITSNLSRKITEWLTKCNLYDKWYYQFTVYSLRRGSYIFKAASIIWFTFIFIGSSYRLSHVERVDKWCANLSNI